MLKSRGIWQKKLRKYPVKIRMEKDAKYDTMAEAAKGDICLERFTTGEGTHERKKIND